MGRTGGYRRGSSGAAMGRWRREPPKDHDLGNASSDLDAEWELVARAQAGDRAAFEALFDAYWHPVVAYCAVRLGGDQAAAQDVAQTIVIDVHAQLLRFSPRGSASFRSWLFAIARNKTIDAQRRRTRERTVPFPEAAPWVDPASSPEDVAVRASERAHFRKLLASLPKEQREVLELRAGELETREIASVLRLTEANVRKLQERALKTLRARIPTMTGGAS